MHQSRATLVRISFFSFSLERERSAGEMAHRCRHTGASVFDRRQKICDSAARFDGLAKLSSRSNGLEGQIEPEIKRCGPTSSRCARSEKCGWKLQSRCNQIECVLFDSNQSNRVPPNSWPWFSCLTSRSTKNPFGSCQWSMISTRQ